MTIDLILRSYGPKSNEEWLFGYGFCVEDNPDDVVVLRLPQSTRIFGIRRDGAFPPGLLAELRELLRDDEADEHANRLNLLDQLGDMLAAKMATIEAPIETGDNVRADVRRNIALYRQGQVDVLRAAIQHQGELFELALEAARDAGLDIESD